jgi:hypothetical protein
MLLLLLLLLADQAAMLLQRANPHASPQYKNFAAHPHHP